MTGTSVSSCAALSVVTTTLLSKANIFGGAQYQSSSGLWSSATALAASTTNIIPFWGRVGPGWYVAKASTALTYTLTTQSGLYTSTS